MPVFNVEVPANVEVDFEVYCSCGEGLCNQSETRLSRARSYPQVVIEPCKRCLAAAWDEGYQDAVAETE